MDNGLIHLSESLPRQLGEAPNSYALMYFSHHVVSGECSSL